jgi:hypothetical protein
MQQPYMDGLREAVQAMAYVQELLARHPELVEGGEG